MRITIASEVLAQDYDGEPVTPESVTEYVQTAGAHLVPGVTDWDNLSVTFPTPDRMLLRADLATVDRVTEGEWRGQKVSEQWISGYIGGADTYWLMPEVFRATDIEFAN